MKKIALILSSILLALLATPLIAQQVKPKFTKFILVSYRPSGSGNKKFIRVENYLEINSEGVLHYAVNRFDNYYGDLSYKGNTADTVYAIPDSVIAGLNKVFADDKLNYPLESKKLPQGAHFAGPFTFISYTDSGGNTHNSILAGSPAERDVKNIVEKLWHLPFPRIEHNGKVYRNKGIEAQILACHNAAKNRPDVEAPPTLRELEIAPPPKQ